MGNDNGYGALGRRTFLGAVGLAGTAAVLPASAQGRSRAGAPSVALPAPRPGAKRMPESFMWGASTAGHQIEGNNINADAWVMENVKPTIFEQPSGDADDSLNRYREDIDLLKSFGFNTYRFSLEWSRIEPTEGHFSNAALDHYKRMIAYCHEVGIRPAVSFNHYTTPIWFAASGSVLRPDGADIFARYCHKAAEHLADGMAAAFTFNEPQAVRILDVLAGGQLRPALAAMAAASAKAVGATRFETWKTYDPDASLQPLIDAHKKAYQAIKSVRSDLPTGVCLATIDYRGVGPNNRAAEIQQQIDGAWLEAAKTGDFVGVQNYWPLFFDAKGFVPTPNKGADKNSLGFEIDPKSLSNCVRHVHKVTGKPILVTENGMETTDDAKRIRYTMATLAELGVAMSDGVPLLGYLHWSLIDNYEWGSYAPRYGLVEVDRTTFKRMPKPSAYALGAFAKRNVL